jgi:hypothetical protein
MIKRKRKNKLSLLNSPKIKLKLHKSRQNQMMIKKATTIIMKMALKKRNKNSDELNNLEKKLISIIGLFK